MRHQDALDQLARETGRARTRIGWERALRLALPAALAVAAWAIAALIGLHERLPFLAQSLTAFAVVLGLALLAVRAARRWRRPSEDEARTRLAHDSQLDLGAFESLRDRPSKYDPLSVALWRREQDQAFKRAGAAKAGPVRPHLDELDRFKLRYVVGAALIAALVVAGPNAGDRLARAFLPDPGPLMGDQPMQIEAWATPADYTHAAPISLSDRVGERVETPPSIEATVRVTGPAGAPLLVYQGEGGRREVRFQRGADGAWEAQLEIPGNGRLKVVRFHTRAAWRIAPAPDRAPRAMFAAPLAALAEERVDVAWSASDDYGVARMALRVRPVNPPEGLSQAPPIDTPIETPAGDLTEATGETELDLAAHPYAGLEVEARVVAFDARGQEGQSEALRFTLPEKVFLQPLAQAAIEIRRHILTERRAYRSKRPERVRTIPAGDIVLGSQRIETRDYERRPAIRRAPEGIRTAARLLDALTMSPQDGYFRDLAVYFGLRFARSELAAASAIEETNLAAEILWRTALRAEYGGAADARRQLELAQQALAEALANGAPQERIRQLMEALRRATDNYLQALVQEAIRNGETAETQEDTQDQAQVSEQDIQQLLREVERLTEQGRTQEAQAMLQMLANILSNLDARLAEGGQGEESGQESEQNQQMQQSMDQLSEAMGEQRALRDETQQQQQQEQQSGGGSGGEQEGGQGGDDLAQRQAEIRESLGEAQRQSDAAGAAPSQELDAANRAMQQAENALRRGDLEAAEAAQNAALQAMREGADQLAAEMRERGGEQGEQGGEGPRDPLGRLMPSGGAGEGDTQVPTDLDPAQAREILDEIRRRAQDANRPEAERDYLRRLLDRFSDS
ncbi:MAG: DUF4175 domain-containing protein [Hyphomonadaceae bacterium]